MNRPREELKGIAHALHQGGRSQTQIGRGLGVSRQTVSRWLSQRPLNIPSLESLCYLAVAGGVVLIESPRCYRGSLKAMARALRQTSLSQTAIGRKLGVPQQTISRWLKS